MLLKATIKPFKLNYVLFYINIKKQLLESVMNMKKIRVTIANLVNNVEVIVLTVILFITFPFYKNRLIKYIEERLNNQ